MTNTDIDALARLLDGDLPDEEATAEARELSAFAQALESAARPPAVRMERKADLRAMLVEAAREQAAPPTWMLRMRSAAGDATARWRYSMRTAAATGAAALALSSGGVALATHRATPSDPFYAVKLTIEDIRVAFIGDQVARGRQLLSYVEQRLAEAEASAAVGDMAAARHALQEADASSRAAAGYIIRASQEQGDPTLLELLTTFSTLQRERISSLLPLLSGDARLAARDAMVALARIDQRVAVLSGPCTACDDIAGSSAGTGRARRNRDRQVQDAAVGGADFDMSFIPPASQPFSPCDCVTAPSPAAKGEAAGTSKDAKNAGGGKVDGNKAREPADEPADDPNPLPDPNPPDDPGHEDPVRSVREPVDEVEDGVDELIDDILGKPTPTPLPTPSLPTPSLPGGSPVPDVEVPDIKLP
ncbi:MAG: hypothetical protein GEU74_05455 [Nitriliruptorales bacterium]|nr:hypothetical protein [Nitriliruptorales bacterium]